MTTDLKWPIIETNGEDGKCPKCGDKMLIKLSSLDLKSCNTCKIHLVWVLKEGERRTI